MKLINEKGKLFGIINIIDLAVILAIVAIAAVFSFKALGKDPLPNPGGETKELYATVRIVMRNEFVSTITKGDRLISLLKPEDAYVESVTSRPLEMLLSTDDGRNVYTVDPRRSEVSVTFKMETPASSSIIKLGSQDVAASKTFILKTQKYEFSGYIEKIEIK